MKTIPTFEKFVNESASHDAFVIHTLVGCGQDAAQNFIDDFDINAKKLIDYIRNNKDKVMDVAEYISGKPDTVGGVEKLRQAFIKK